jgi:P-type Cu2+ transporter
LERADRVDSRAAKECFHCGLPAPSDGPSLTAEIDGKSYPMCCAGCAAVARAIETAGLSRYYRERTARASTAQDFATESLRQLEVFNNPLVQRSFVSSPTEGSREAALILEGIQCAACVWLNEQHLKDLPGMLEVQVNYATRRARIRWDEQQIQLSEIMRSVRDIGYEAYPYDPGHQQELLDIERRKLLKRLAVAGALGMQVMILAVALYTGVWTGIEERYRDFFQKLSLLITLPVLFYSAQPFFVTAWRDLSNRRAGMDVPVTLGISLAFAASTMSIVTGTGEVYFDSICMFVFLLLGTRTLELGARKSAADAADVIGQARPAAANRLDGEGDIEQIAAVELNPGDKVLVRPGETVPADGIIIQGRSSIDEAILTGEAMPQSRREGDEVIGASINIESPITVEVMRTGADSALSQIQQLLDRALMGKPRVSQLADRISGIFIMTVLLIATLVAGYWWQTGAEDWLSITVSVLVVSCPCALSLATPAAVTATVGHLMKKGVLLTRARTLETLARATKVVFDKTGTLTLGELRCSSIRVAEGVDHNDVLQIAAALEQHSEHPVGRAIMRAGIDFELPEIDNVVNEPGGGIYAEIKGDTYWIGSPHFIQQKTGAVSESIDAVSSTTVLLADSDSILAEFLFSDELREDAPELIERLRKLGLRLAMLSGDQCGPVSVVADALQIEPAQWQLSPADKLKAVNHDQKLGETVAMVGDGVNDAPVLAGADVSIAVARASPLAAATADVVILNDDIRMVAEAIRAGRRTLGVIRQNLAWALVYNLAALPAAAFGFVPPWLAAIGMSASSLIVIANALRLR